MVFLAREGELGLVWWILGLVLLNLVTDLADYWFNVGFLFSIGFFLICLCDVNKVDEKLVVLAKSLIDV